MKITADITFRLNYKEFNIDVKNTHNREIYFKVYEKGRNGWTDVTPTASKYIVEDFKKTEEYKKIKLVFENILKDYGY